MLKAIFNLEQDEITLPQDNTKISNLEFISTFSLQSEKSAFSTDESILENVRFRYPVFIPENHKADHVIIYLHGLNERTWHKHLAGAKYLCENSGMAVILFPLSFHINRGLPEWSDTRKMSVPFEKRKQTYPGIKEASIVNFALSERLTECPERFILSGFQSMMDLTKLMEEIVAGKHPMFKKNTRIDLFAYSISCMLLQSMMISNPNQILSRSRIILFAGGSLFSHIRGVSKYIMDSVAFAAIHKYYMGFAAGGAKCTKEMKSWITDHHFGRSFLSLLTCDFLKEERMRAFDDFSDNTLILSLQNDQIMPVEGIRIAMGEQYSKSQKFRVLDFPYAYTHENPFPVLYNKLTEQVDEAFHSVFNPALQFIAG